MRKSPVSGAGNKALPFQSFKIPQTWKLIYWSTHVTNWQQIKQLMVSQSLYSSGHQGFRSVSAKKLPWTTLQDKCNASKWPQIETLSVCVRTLHLDFREYAWTSFAWEFPLTTGLSSPSIQTPSNAVLHWPCPKRASKLLLSPASRFPLWCPRMQGQLIRCILRMTHQCNSHQCLTFSVWPWTLLETELSSSSPLSAWKTRHTVSSQRSHPWT